VTDRSSTKEPSSRARGLVVGVLLAALLGAGGGRLLVDRVATRVAAQLHAAVDRPLAAPASSLETGPLPEDPLEVFFADDPTALEDPRLALRPRALGERRAPLSDAGRLSLLPTRAFAGGTGQASDTLAKKPVPKGIFVPAATIVRFAKRANVQGTPVSNGVEVHGAGALGVADGDVLTHVDGQKIASVADATALVLRAIGAGRSTVGGTLARGTETYPITVEIPASVSGKKPAK